MAVPPDTRRDVRVMDALGVPRARIARSLGGVSRNTVARYADMGDMSPVAPVPRVGPLAAAGPHAAWIGSVPEADLGAPGSGATPPGGSTTGSSPSAATRAPTRPSADASRPGGGGARPRRRASWSWSGRPARRRWTSGASAAFSPGSAPT